MMDDTIITYWFFDKSQIDLKIIDFTPVFLSKKFIIEGNTIVTTDQLYIRDHCVSLSILLHNCFVACRVNDNNVNDFELCYRGKVILETTSSNSTTKMARLLRLLTNCDIVPLKKEELWIDMVKVLNVIYNNFTNDEKYIKKNLYALVKKNKPSKYGHPPIDTMDIKITL